jgi:hypothetical protein
MSKPRRLKSLYSDKPSAITPDLSRTELLRVVPDTKTERALYRMLVFERHKNARLLLEIKALKEKASRPYTNRQLQQLTRELFKDILR